MLFGGCGGSHFEGGRRDRANARRLSNRPSRRVGEERLENQRIQAVAATNRAESAEDGIASQRQVTYGIEHLVAHELEGIAQAFAVHDAAFADGDGVGEVGTECQAGLPQAFDVGHETERA